MHGLSNNMHQYDVWPRFDALDDVLIDLRKKKRKDKNIVELGSASSRDVQ